MDMIFDLQMPMWKCGWATWLEYIGNCVACNALRHLAHPVDVHGTDNDEMDAKVCRAYLAV